MGTKSTTSDTTKARVAASVVAALTAAGISRLEASERTGIPRSTFYRKAEGAGKAFDVDELAAIAGILGTTPSEILARAEERAA